MTTSPPARNIALLALAQALLLINGVTLVAVSSLVGMALAGDRRLATLPLTALVVGTALSTLPAAYFMKRYGRRAGFMLGAAIGLAGALLCAQATLQGQFWLLCGGLFCAGIYGAFGQQYRFAAADAVSVSWKSRAISLTLAGGIAGGVVGPELGKLTRGLMDAPFAATYLALAAMAGIALFVASRLEIPALNAQEQQSQGRPLRVIMGQPAYAVALLAATAGYGVMNLLMTATPIAMDLCRHPFSEVAFVIEWHVIGMFAPSFFTGGLIRRFGVGRVMLTGAALMLACIAITFSGLSVIHFWWALILLGVGWNFLFIGGTTLLTETYRPEERAKAQGANDFIVFAVQGLTSLGSGVMISAAGWHTLNLLALPIVAVTALATGFWMYRRSNKQ
jgi:MFS family permease